MTNNPTVYHIEGDLTATACDGPAVIDTLTRMLRDKGVRGSDYQEALDEASRWTASRPAVGQKKSFKAARLSFTVSHDERSAYYKR